MPFPGTITQLHAIDRRQDRTVEPTDEPVGIRRVRSFVHLAVVLVMLAPRSLFAAPADGRPGAPTNLPSIDPLDDLLQRIKSAAADTNVSELLNEAERVIRTAPADARAYRAHLWALESVMLRPLANSEQRLTDVLVTREPGLDYAKLADQLRSLVADVDAILSLAPEPVYRRLRTKRANQEAQARRLADENKKSAPPVPVVPVINGTAANASTLAATANPGGSAGTGGIVKGNEGAAAIGPGAVRQYVYLEQKDELRDRDDGPARSTVSDPRRLPNALGVVFVVLGSAALGGSFALLNHAVESPNGSQRASASHVANGAALALGGSALVGGGTGLLVSTAVEMEPRKARAFRQGSWAFLAIAGGFAVGSIALAVDAHDTWETLHSNRQPYDQSNAKFNHAFVLGSLALGQFSLFVGMRRGASPTRERETQVLKRRPLSIGLMNRGVFLSGGFQW